MTRNSPEQPSALDALRAASKHTPGPWRISNAKPTKTRGIDILGGYQMFVAHVPVPPAYMADHPEHANARLIAAAPELYEALKTTLREIARTGRLSDKTAMDGFAAIGKAVPP